MDKLFSVCYLGKPISEVTQASTIEVNELFDEILKCSI